ncbi:MAG: hypothetical protein IPH36_00080 [Saprospiraceae bacterium]|nr:hypothetical protein [Saprospiraceae bacterium]
MSIIIVDSGSTKADWVWTDGLESKVFTTQGINPTTGSGLEQKLPENLVELIYKSTDVFFLCSRRNRVSSHPQHAKNVWENGTGTGTKDSNRK